MSSMNLETQILSYLKTNPNSNARQISGALSTDKTKVNSVLYSQKDKLFTLHETKPPTWSVKIAVQTTINLSTAKFHILRTSEPIHIDFQGGDWALTIQISETSRNDPVVSLERTGPNAALVKVSTSVMNGEKSDSERFPDVVLALAASALVWEIALQNGAIREDKFNFQDALKDIYLSLGTHDVRTQNRI